MVFAALIDGSNIAATIDHFCPARLFHLAQTKVGN